MALFGRQTRQDEERAEAYRQWFVRQHPLAVASLVLCTFSLTHLGTLWVDTIAGVVLGAMAIRSANRSTGRQSALLAYVGIALGLISMACAVVIYFVIRPTG